MPNKKKSSPTTEASETSKKRIQISQSDVPSYSLEQALKIPKALIEHYASKPASPLRVAQALDVQPGSGHFRMLCGAAISYGLVSGGAFANEIMLEPLGKRILKPLHEGDDLQAQREAFLKPRIIKEFIEKYNNSQIPRQDIAFNIIEELGVPKNKVEAVFNLIIESAKSLGLITEIKSKLYIDLQGTSTSSQESTSSGASNAHSIEMKVEDLKNDTKELDSLLKQHEFNPQKLPPIDLTKKRRVFITHGKNKAFVEPIKKLLNFGELEPVVSVDRQSVSQPVPDKVLNEMRTCGAAIIHVDAEMKVFDQEAKEHIVLNPNVLSEIGAAMALYGRRFILLVKSGVTLPSNLQGLFEVRYTGDTLDGEATIKLLEAINDMKKQTIPSDAVTG